MLNPRVTKKTVHILINGPGATSAIDFPDPDPARYWHCRAYVACTPLLTHTSCCRSGGRFAVVDRSLWSACIDAVLEYCRVVYELQPVGASVCVQVHQNDREPKHLNSWDPRDQSLACIQKNLDDVGPSEGVVSSKQAVDHVLRMIFNDMAAEYTVEYRVILILWPRAIGITDQDIGEEDRQISYAFESQMKSLAKTTGLKAQLQVIWVTDPLSTPISTQKPSLGGGAVADSMHATLCGPTQLKSLLYQLVQRHFHLQCVRVTNIPMASLQKVDAEKSKDNKKEETVELLCCGSEGKSHHAPPGSPPTHRCYLTPRALLHL